MYDFWLRDFMLFIGLDMAESVYSFLMLLQIGVAFLFLPLLVFFRRNYNARCFIIGLVTPIPHIYILNLISPRSFAFRPLWTYIWMDDPWIYYLAGALSLQHFSSLLIPLTYGFFISRLFLFKAGNSKPRINIIGFLWASAGFAICAFLIVAPYEYCRLNFLGGGPIP